MTNHQNTRSRASLSRQHARHTRTVRWARIDGRLVKRPYSRANSRSDEQPPNQSSNLTR